MHAPSERWIQAATKAGPEDVTVLCGRDKSLTHRAVMFASLASGMSRIHHPLLGADCLSTMDCFRALGVRIEQPRADQLVVLSQGFKRFQQPTQALDCGNSGTTARLITGILAAQDGLTCELIGDASLSQRPMRRVVEPLRAMGAHIEGHDNGHLLPIRIQGRLLQARSHEVDKASAQVKSALLLAGLFCPGTTAVKLPAGSRDHTERMLQRMGAKIERREQAGYEEVCVTGPFVPIASEFVIPVDPSSAAFFAVMGLLRPVGRLTLPHVLNNPTRIGFLRVLQRMSGAITLTLEEDHRYAEPVMRIQAEGGKVLRATDIQAHEVPTLVDEIPILAVAAAFADGPSRFSGLEELRVKESDRLTKTAELLRLAGSDVRIEGDDLWIGGGLREVQAFRYDSVGDHRLAMAAAILARRCKKPCCILDPECVRVSFPDFYEVLETV